MAKCRWAALSGKVSERCESLFILSMRVELAKIWIEMDSAVVPNSKFYRSLVSKG